LRGMLFLIHQGNKNSGSFCSLFLKNHFERISTTFGHFRIVTYQFIKLQQNSEHKSMQIYRTLSFRNDYIVSFFEKLLFST